MKENRFQKYVYGGITAVLVSMIPLLVIFLILEREAISLFVDELISILSPIIVGAVLTFLISPIYNKTRDAVRAKTEKYSKRMWQARGYVPTSGYSGEVPYMGFSG